MSFLLIAICVFVVLTASLAYAHCDIPCGIYTPDGARLAAKTVWTMVKKIEELKTPLVDHNALVRMIQVKEAHAELCKREILILWTDYFKPEHLIAFPKLHETVWKAAKLCSKTKQGMDLAAAEELQRAVEEIAGAFAQAEEAKKKAPAHAGAR